MNRHMPNNAGGAEDEQPAVYRGNPQPSATGSYNSSGSPKSSFNVINLFCIIGRRWLSVVLLAVLGALGAVFYIQNAIPVYRAESALEMNVRRAKVINTDAIYEDPNAARDTDIIFNTRFAKFRSPAMERLVAQEYIKAYPDHTKTSRGVPISEYTLSIWVRDISWFKDPDANIVYVSYAGTDPEFTAQLVNVVSHCAGLLMMQENRAQSDEAVKWLLSQAEEKREVVESVERELTVLREDLQLDASLQKKEALNLALLSLAQAREERVTDLASRRTVYKFVTGLRASEQSPEMLPPGLPKEEELQELIRTWRSAHDELLLASDRYTEIHPEYKKASDLEFRAHTRLDEFIELSTKGVENEIKLLEQQIAQMEKRIEGMKAEQLVLDQTTSSGLLQVQEIERKRDIASDSYQSVLKRIEEARLSADENMAFTKVLKDARVPKTPFSPKKLQVLFMGSFLGALLGGLISIIMAFWTDKIESVTALKDLGMNVLATVPAHKKCNSRTELATIGLRHKFNPVVESFSGLNAMLSSDRFASQSRLLLMCSIGPGAGKTISACNLAIYSAHNGSKTLLIDCDLRRPQIATVFDVNEDHPSLIDWLSKDSGTGFEKLVYSDVMDNLDIISSRPNPDVSPAELLGRDSLASLLEWAKGRYDKVIIDSPPLGPVGDAQMLANLSDSVLLVARIGKTRRRSLLFAMNRFSEMNVNILGCIANDVNNSIAGMFAGAEGYGHGFGGYGYGAANTE